MNEVTLQVYDEHGAPMNNEVYDDDYNLITVPVTKTFTAGGAFDVNNLVRININGQVSVTRAEVLMFLLDFVFQNTALKDMLGNLLGMNLTDDNDEIENPELIDVLLTNVFNNESALVNLVVSLLTGYETIEGNEIELDPIQAEYHYPFYEDVGYDSLDEVREAKENGLDVSEVSRIKTAAAIDNLDALVGTVLNLFKGTLFAEDDPNTEKDESGVFTKMDLNLNANSDLTVKNLANALIEKFLYDNESLSNFTSLLINLLGNSSSAKIITMILTILDGAGYSFTPQTVKKNVTGLIDDLAEIIGDKTKWTDVAKDHLQYVYYYTTPSSKEGEDPIETNLYSPLSISEMRRDPDTGEFLLEDTKGVDHVVDPRFLQAQDKDGNDLWIAVDDPTATPVSERQDGVKYEPYYSDVQEQSVRLTLDFGFRDDMTVFEKRDHFVDLLWSMVAPLHGVFELLFTDQKLVIYDRIKINGLPGYANVLIHLFNALAIGKLEDEDGNPYLNTVVYDYSLNQPVTRTFDNQGNVVYNANYDVNGRNFYADGESYMYAVYGIDREPGGEGNATDNLKMLLKTLVDVIFALLDSLCDRPVNTLLTILPYLCRYIGNDAIDDIFYNLLAPVTTILKMVDRIYSFDILSMVKNLLENVITNAITSADDEEEVSPTAAPTDMPTVGAALARYVLDAIERAEGDKPDDAGFDSMDEFLSTALEPLVSTDGNENNNNNNEDENNNSTGGTDLESLLQKNDSTLMEIVWKFINNFVISIDTKQDGVDKKVNLPLSAIIPNTLMEDIASIAWLYNNNEPNRTPKAVVDVASRSITRYEVQEEEDYAVDRESVLLRILYILVFNEGIRSFAVDLLGIDYENLGLDKEYGAEFDGSNTDFLLAVLIESVFTDAEPVLRLLIDLLSWYEIVYAPKSVRTEYNLNYAGDFDYEGNDINKTQLEALPGNLDDLIGAIVPLLGSVMNMSALTNLTFTGDDTSEIVKNLLVQLLQDQVKDGKKTKGVITSLIIALVNALGGNDSMATVLDLLPGIIRGLDLRLSYFKSISPAFNEFFADCKTWADAYNSFKTKARWSLMTEDQVSVRRGNTIEIFNSATDTDPVKRAVISGDTILVFDVSRKTDPSDSNSTIEVENLVNFLVARGDVTYVYGVDNNGNQKETPDTCYLTESGYQGYRIELSDGVAKQTEVLDEHGNKIQIGTEDDGVTPIYQMEYVFVYEVTDFGGADTESFGINTYEKLTSFLADLLTPLVPVFRVLLTEEDLVALDGLHIVGGDGYDRAIIPLFEMFGIPNILSKREFMELVSASSYEATEEEIAEMKQIGGYVSDSDAAEAVVRNKADRAFAGQIMVYLDAAITKIANAPITTIVDLLPQLIFFIYSNGLQQAVEQLVAPLVTLVDMVNDVTGAEVEIERAGGTNKDGGKTFSALPIYKFLVNLIKGKNPESSTLVKMFGGVEALDAVEDFYDLTELIVSCTGIENIIATLLEDNNITNIGTYEIVIDGETITKEITPESLFESILELTCRIVDVETVRLFGSTDEEGRFPNLPRTVKGVLANRADTLVRVIGDVLLGGDLVPSIIENATGNPLEGILKTIIGNITGDNRYNVLKVLLAYFNDYTVKPMALEYLSFDKIDYPYETYTDSTTLTSRKLRRAIRKLDKTLTTLVPELLQIISETLDEDNTFKILIDRIYKKGQSLEDFVDELLEQYALKDDIINTIVGALIGMLGLDSADTFETVMPYLDMLVGIDLTPAGYADAAGQNNVFRDFLEDAINAALSLNPSKDKLDADGNPVYEKDNDGNYIISEETGQKIVVQIPRTREDVKWTEIASLYKQHVYAYKTYKFEYLIETDEEGNPVLDEDNNATFVKDENGNRIVKLDKNGDPVYALNNNGNRIPVTDAYNQIVYHEYTAMNAESLANMTAEIETEGVTITVELLPLIRKEYIIPATQDGAEPTATTVYVPEEQTTYAVDNGTDIVRYELHPVSHYTYSVTSGDTVKVSDYYSSDETVRETLQAKIDGVTRNLTLVEETIQQERAAISDVNDETHFIYSTYEFELDAAGDIALDDEGNPIYALDGENNKIVATDSTGNVIYRDYYTHNADEIESLTANVQVGRFTVPVTLIPVIAHTYMLGDESRTVYLPEGSTEVEIAGVVYPVTAVSPVEMEHQMISRAKDWGIDSISTGTHTERTRAKADRFIEILWGLVSPLEFVLDFLLRGQEGDDIELLRAEGATKGVVTVKGNNGYKTAIYELLRVLSLDSTEIMSPDEYISASTRGSKKTLTAITDPIIQLVYDICEKPLETVLTILAKLSYFLSNDGLEAVVTSLISPALALLDIADPITGDVIDDLLSDLINKYLADYMPEDSGTLSEDGKTRHYTLKDLLGIAGDDGSNIVRILNEVLSRVIINLNEDSRIRKYVYRYDTGEVDDEGNPVYAEYYSRKADETTFTIAHESESYGTTYDLEPLYLYQYATLRTDKNGDPIPVYEVDEQGHDVLDEHGDPVVATDEHGHVIYEVAKDANNEVIYAQHHDILGVTTFTEKVGSVDVVYDLTPLYAYVYYLDTYGDGDEVSLEWTYSTDPDLQEFTFGGETYTIADHTLENRGLARYRALEQQVVGRVFNMLKTTFFTDYAEHAIIINEQTLASKVYYWYHNIVTDPETGETVSDTLTKIPAREYKESIHGPIEPNMTKYVVTNFTADIADSLTYLLETVVSDRMMSIISEEIVGTLMDDGTAKTLVGDLLTALTTNEFGELALADIVSSLFENYTISYLDLSGRLIDTDHSAYENLSPVENQTQVAELSTKLDNVIKEALPVLPGLLSEFMDLDTTTVNPDGSINIVGTIMNILTSHGEDADKSHILRDVVFDLLDELVFSDQMMSTIVAYLPQVLSGLENALRYIKLTGFNLVYEEYLEHLKETAGEESGAYRGLKELSTDPTIGEAKSWTEIMNILREYVYKYIVGQDQYGNNIYETYVSNDPDLTEFTDDDGNVHQLVQIIAYCYQEYNTDEDGNPIPGSFKENKRGEPVYTTYYDVPGVSVYRTKVGNTMVDYELKEMHRYTYTINRGKTNAQKVTVYLPEGETHITISYDEDNIKIYRLRDQGLVRSEEVRIKLIDWGIDSADSPRDAFIEVISDLLEPFTDVLRAVLQGRYLTIVARPDRDADGKIIKDADGNIQYTYVNVEDDPGQSGEELKNGYIEIMGSNGYSEALVPLFEALGLRAGELMSHEEFGELSTLKDILGYLMDLLYQIIGNIADGPFTFLGENLASLLYFVANDGVYKLVESAIAFVNGALDLINPVFEFELPLDMLKLNDTVSQVFDNEGNPVIGEDGRIEMETTKGLLSLINDAMPLKLDENGDEVPILEITLEMLFTLVGKIGDYEVLPTVRTTGNTYLVNEFGEHVLRPGVIFEEGSIDTIVGKPEYLLPGLLDFIISTPSITDLIIDLLPDSMKETITNLLDADNKQETIDGIVKVLLTLFNKYVVTYLAIEDPEEGLELKKEEIRYYEEGGDPRKMRTVTKEETQDALSIIDKLITPILTIFGMKSLNEMITDFLFDNDTLSGLIGSAIGALATIDPKTLSTIDTVLSVLKSLDIIDLQLTPNGYKDALKDEYGTFKAFLEDAVVYGIHQKDENGELLIDGEGDYILDYKLDEEGERISEYVLDEYGEKIPIYEIDEETGEFILDENDEKIQAYEKDDNGEYKLDENGEKIPVYEKTYVLKTPADATWSDVEDYLKTFDQYVYTYTHLKLEYDPMTGESTINEVTEEYYDEQAGLRTIVEGGRTIKVYPVMEEKDGEEVQKTKNFYAWGVDDNESLISLVCELVSPLNVLLELVLGGGVQYFDADAEDPVYGKSISAFKEINIMGGSGYDYAIIPLFEALGMTVKDSPSDETGNFLSAEDYADALERGTSPLEPILDTLLNGVLTEEHLNKPLEYILSIIANLAYTISKDGLTTIVSNLIAPISALIRAIEDLMPMAVVIDLSALLEDDKEEEPAETEEPAEGEEANEEEAKKSLVNFWIGEDVKRNGAEVGLTVDLNAITLQDIIQGLVGKFVEGLNFEFRFSKLAAQSALLDPDTGEILYTDSAVDETWDILKSKRTGDISTEAHRLWGKNIQGDVADTFIAITDMLLTTENVEAILDMVGFDVDDLDNATLRDILNRLIETPSKVVDALIKLVNLKYDATTFPMVFYYVGTLVYDYSKGDTDKAGTTAAIDKLDKVLNHAVPRVLHVLAQQDGAANLIVELDRKFNHVDPDTGKVTYGATISNLLNYVLETYVINDNAINNILTMLVNALGNMSEDTFKMISNIVKDAIGIDLTPEGVAAASSGTHLESFFGEATTWKELADTYMRSVYKYATYELDADGVAVLDEENNPVIATDDDGNVIYETYYDVAADKTTYTDEAGNVYTLIPQALYKYATYKTENGELVLEDGAPVVATDKDGKIIYADYVGDAGMTELEAKVGSADVTYTLIEVHTFTYTVPSAYEDEEPTVVEVNDLAGTTEITVGKGDKAVTYPLTDKGVTLQRVVHVDADWGVDSQTNFADKRDQFLDIVYEVTAILEPVLVWLLKGENLRLLIDDLQLPGALGYDNAIVPLLRAFGIKLRTGEQLGIDSTANDMIKEIVSGLLGLVDRLAESPIKTLLNTIGELSFFVANNGVNQVLSNLLRPIESFVYSLGIITPEDVDALLGEYIVINDKHYGLTDLKNIAGKDGSGLVDFLNQILQGVTVKDEDGNEIPVTAELSPKLFEDLARTCIRITDPSGKYDQTHDDPRPEEDTEDNIVNDWTVDTTDVLMYLLQTVFSEEILDLICTVANIDKTSDVGAIVTGLAGKQDEVVDIIVMLLTEYSVEYEKLDSAVHTKLVPELKEGTEATKEQIGTALAGLDTLVTTLIGFFTGGKDLEGLINSLLVENDLGNLLMNALIPVLAGLDLDMILDYVRALTNIDLDLTPQAFAANRFGSRLAEFIGDAETWQEISDKYQSHVYAYATYKLDDDGKIELDGEGNKIYATDKDGEIIYELYYGAEGETTYTETKDDVAITYDLIPVYAFRYSTVNDSGETVDHTVYLRDGVTSYTDGKGNVYDDLTELYHYTYPTYATDKKGNFLKDGEGNYLIAVDDEGNTIYGDYYGPIGETTYTEGKGDNAVTYPLTIKGRAQQITMHSTFDWQIEDLEGIINLVSDFLAPLEIVLEIVLAGEQIIVIEDTKDDGTRGDDIRIYGGNGYNYAIIPLLEAFGVTAEDGLKTAAQFQTDVLDNDAETSLHYILMLIKGVLDDLLKAPLTTLLSKLANLCFFIGSNGISTVAKNLLAPVNILLKQVDDAVPLAININLNNIGVDGTDIVEMYLGKEHPGVPAGITIDLEADKLSNLVNSFISSIEIGDYTLELSLDLDWIKLGRFMAKVADGEPIVNGATLEMIDTLQVYDIGTVINGDAHNLVNYVGDVTDTFITLLDTALTIDNTESLRGLILSLVPDSLGETKLVIEDILSDPDVFYNMIIALLVLLTTGYETELYEYIYYYLGNIDYHKDGVDNVIESLDIVVSKAAPAVIGILADNERKKPADEQSKLIVNLDDQNCESLADIVDYLLDDMLFTQDMMNTITSAVLKILGQYIQPALAVQLNTLIGIDLSVKSFLDQVNNAEFTAFIRDGLTIPTDADGDEVWDEISWATILDNHSHTETKEDGTVETVVDPVFTVVATEEKSAQDVFMDDLYSLLMPLDSLLAFLLTGKDLVLHVDETKELVRLKAGTAYNDALLEFLYNGLGIKDMKLYDGEGHKLAIERRLATASTTGVEALRNTVSYYVIDVLLQNLKTAPFTTLLTMLGNLSFFIANNEVSVFLKNLLAPALGLLKSLNSVISMDQIDAIVASFVKIGDKSYGLTDLLEIADARGANLVEMLNGLLTKIQITSTEDGTVYNFGVLPKTLFRDIANAAIKIDRTYTPGEALVPEETRVSAWHVEIDDTLMAILSAFLKRDFLVSLTQSLNIEATNEDGEENMVYNILMCLDGKADAVINILLKLFNMYLVEFKVYKQEELVKSDEANTTNNYEEGKQEALNDAIAKIDAMIPAILSLVGQEGDLKTMINNLIADADLGNTIMGALVPVLANLPAETIDTILGYVRTLTNMTDIDINPQAFTDGFFGSKLPEFIGDAQTWSDVQKNNTQYVFTYQLVEKDDDGNINPVVKDDAPVYKNYYSADPSQTTYTDEEIGYTYTLIPMYQYSYTADGEEHIVYAKAGTTTYTDGDSTFEVVPVFHYIYETTDEEGVVTRHDYYSTEIGLTTTTIGEGENAQVVTLTDLGQARQTAVHFDWEIETLMDLGNLVSDMTQPLNDILALILMGGTERNRFELVGIHTGSKITAFEKINILGGNGYNYSIIPLLELLGVKTTGASTRTDKDTAVLLNQSQYEAAVAENHGNVLYPILNMLLTRVDDILSSPVDQVLSIFAHLCYMVAEDNLEKIISNLIAPVNTLLEAVDELIPFAVRIDLAEIIGGGENGVMTFIAKEHSGIPAGLTIALSSADINNLITSLLGKIEINGNKLNLAINLDWKWMATKASRDADGDYIADTLKSQLNNKYDIYNDTSKYKGTMYTVIGDKANALVTLIEAVLTKENIDAILDAAEVELPDTIKDVIDNLIDDPSQIFDLITTLFGDLTPFDIPVQNVKVVPTMMGADYRSYPSALTKGNAAVVANRLDEVINTIMGMAGAGSLKQLVETNLFKDDLITNLMNKIAGAFGGFEGAMDIILKLSGGEIDLSLAHFTEYYQSIGFTPAYNALADKLSWSEVDFTGTVWGIHDAYTFADTFAKLFLPFENVLKILLLGSAASNGGEALTLTLADAVTLTGSDAYDSAIIPLLEALGLRADQLMSLAEFRNYVKADHTQLLRYIFNRIAVRLDEILNAPGDQVLNMLPTLAYFLGSGGLYCVAQNLLAPLFKVGLVAAKIFGYDLTTYLDLGVLLNDLVHINLNIGGKPLSISIPTVDFFKLAMYGSSDSEEVATARSKAVNSFSDPLTHKKVNDYLRNYPKGYEDRTNKVTQTHMTANKGDTLVVALTWLLHALGYSENRDALATWIGALLGMNDSGVNTLKVLFNKLFNVATTGSLAELIVSAVLNMVGIGITINALFKRDYDSVVSILQQIFDTIGNGADPESAYAGLARALDEMSGGTWSGTVGSPDPTQPTQPPTQPTSPTEPSSEPTQPSNPTQPTEPTQPPTQPTQPPTQPTRPTQPATQATQQSTTASSSMTQTTGESLNFFQKLIKAIREFFAKLFSFGR